MKTLALFLIVVFLLGCQSKVEDIRVIDTHIHFFDSSREEGIMWPPKTWKELHKPTFPRHFTETAKANNVQKAVVVQASNWVIDGQWNLDVTAGMADFYPGIVCNLSTLGTKQFRTDIDKLLKDPRIVGLRITHPPENRPFFTEEMLDDLKYIASKNLSLDVLTRRFDFEEIIKIADKIPNLRIMTGLHGKSPEQIKKIASRKNVNCKMGIPTKKPKAEIDAYLNLIWQTFGEDRLMFGSNWPATDKESYYLKKKTLYDFLKDKGSSAIDKVFYKNAERLYRLK